MATSQEHRRSRADRAGWIALFAVVALVTAVKIALILAGPDYDGDAYAHAMSGRRALLTPGDVTVHWVWLPLLHALYAGATAAGSGLTAIRLLNALISSAAALLLAWHLHDHLRRTDAAATSIVPWLAGALLALDPLCVWLGVTGQTEPLFQILVLGACVFCERRAFVAAGALLAAAALTRYEAWPLVAALPWVAASREQAPSEKKSLSEEQALSGEQAPSPERAWSLRAQALWALPSLAIAGWCLFHYRATGEPFQFLRLNREFVEGYLAGVGYPWGKQPILPLMAVFYVTVVPVWNMLGPVHALALPGVLRARRELPRAFLILGAALVAIVTAGFLRRTHLGLPRHAVVFAPLFCALAALGADVTARAISRRFPRISIDRARAGAAFGVLAIVLFSRTVPKTIELWNVTRVAFTEQAAAARALRDVAGPDEPIFCEDGKIEVLSALAPERFVRWQIPDVAPSHVADLARRTGSALVIAAPSRAAHLPGGRVVWSDDHLAILRFEAPPR